VAVPAAAAGPRDDVGVLKRRLEQAPIYERREILMSFLNVTAAKVMGRDPDQMLDPKATFGALGIDSLMAVELRNALAQALDRTLPPSLVYDYPCIEKLATHLGAEVIGEVRPPTSAARPEAEPALRSGRDRLGALESLSDEDVERLIQAKKTGQRSGG
jgi:acyl carrier protein